MIPPHFSTTYRGRSEQKQKKFDGKPDTTCSKKVPRNINYISNEAKKWKKLGHY